MANSTQRGRKGFISEDDIASVLTRYTAPTILALLQEIAQYPDVKIDWNAMVKKTKTGITNAADYQKLWRCLAYRHTLPETSLDNLEEQPLEDDDSDLEYELEALYPVNGEASLEAAACAKVLLASGLQDDAETVEAPLTINIPTWQDYKSPLDDPLLCSLKGKNITVPVSVQKQSSTAVTTAEEGLDATVSSAGGQDGKGKRKHWTAEEDNELIAAVEKFGKRNWDDILKADIFKGDWTASQLSKRWGIIRKRLKLERGGAKLIAQQRATDRVVASALNVPIITSLLEAYAADVVPNPMVQEAAVAAGARIATQRTAKSLRKAKAARSKKSSMPGVHYICTGLSSASPATYSTSVPSVSPPPPTLAEESQVPSVSVLASASTSCGTVAAGNKTNRVASAGAGNTWEEEDANNWLFSADFEQLSMLFKQLLPDLDMVIGDQTTQNLSMLPTVEAAASDPMQLDNHHIEKEKENTKTSPAAAK